MLALAFSSPTHSHLNRAHAKGKGGKAEADVDTLQAYVHKVLEGCINLSLIGSWQRVFSN